MRTPRPQTHRDFNVATAGWFTVLKTAPRMVALRPRGGLSAISDPSSARATSTETSEQLADRLRTTKISLIGDAGILDRGLLRMALIVLTASTSTLLVLWWIIGFRH